MTDSPLLPPPPQKCDDCGAVMKEGENFALTRTLYDNGKTTTQQYCAKCADKNAWATD